MYADATTAVDFLAWVGTPDLPDLGPRVRDSRRSASELEAEVGDFCAAKGLRGAVADCLRSGALLWHDHLELSHAISQGIASADGSVLHGIMHRREPDYGNAAYWFRRAGEHRAYGVLGRAVGDYLEGQGVTELAAVLAPGGVWDPFAMIDACRAVARRPDLKQVERLQGLQRLEFEVWVKVLLAS